MVCSENGLFGELLDSFQLGIAAELLLRSNVHDFS